MVRGRTSDPSAGYAFRCCAPRAAGYHGRVRETLRRWTARLSRRRDESEADLGLPCVVCGGPAAVWAVMSGDREGVQIIDAYATCAAHQAELEGRVDSKAG